MFDKLGDLTEMMRKFGQLRENMEKATEALRNVQAEGSTGGGAVTVRASGRLEVLSVRIDPKLLADGDCELLEDLVLAATNQALTKAREAAAEHLQSATGNMPLPPGLTNLLGG